MKKYHCGEVCINGHWFPFSMDANDISVVRQSLKRTKEKGKRIGRKYRGRITIQ